VEFNCRNEESYRLFREAVVSWYFYLLRAYKMCKGVKTEFIYFTQRSAASRQHFWYPYRPVMGNVAMCLRILSCFWFI